MITSQQIDNLLNQLGSLLPKTTFPDTFKDTLRDLLQSQFSKLNLVTREEFDAQVKVLARLQAKLEQLETKLTELTTPRSSD